MSYPVCFEKAMRTIINTIREKNYIDQRKFYKNETEKEWILKSEKYDDQNENIQKVVQCVEK